MQSGAESTMTNWCVRGALIRIPQAAVHRGVDIPVKRERARAWEFHTPYRKSVVTALPMCLALLWYGVLRNEGQKVWSSVSTQVQRSQTHLTGTGKSGKFELYVNASLMWPHPSRESKGVWGVVRTTSHTHI